MTTVRIPLPAGTMAVPAARRFTAETLGAWQLADQTQETAELVVSELVGNAVEHGGGSAELRLSLLDGAIRVDVVDGSPELPVLCSPDPVEDRHRGLLIVGALSARWGSEVVGSGKTVWAELACAEAARSPAQEPPAQEPPTQELPAQQPADDQDRSMSG